MDIRDKNKYFDLRSPKLYASEYFYQILESSKMVDLSDLEEIIKVIRDAEKNKNKIYSIGNGGSESISQHFITDFTKGTNNKNFKIKTFNIIFQIIGLTSITLLSDRNSLRYFLISNQPVESGVPQLTIKTPVFPKLITGCC